MGERTARDDADKARSHRSPAPADSDERLEGEASEERNPSRANMDRPLAGRNDTEGVRNAKKED